MSEGQGVHKAGQVLLIVGVIVLALLIGVLIGRRGAQPEPAVQPPPGVQISTEEPPARPSTPLVAPVQAPPAAPVAKVAPDAQVQEDAAAVGMTTRDEPEDKTPPPAPSEPAPSEPAAADPPAN